MDNEDKKVIWGENPEPPPTARESKILSDIYRKEYEEGDAGKLEAIRDLQNVFDELTEEKVIPAFDIMAPFKPQPPAEGRGIKRASKLSLTQSLTPRYRLPPLDMSACKKIPEFASEQNLGLKGSSRVKGQSASVPILSKSSGQKLSENLSQKPRPRGAGRETPIKNMLFPVVKELHKAENVTTDASETDEDKDAFDMVQYDLDYTTSSSTIPQIDERTSSAESEEDWKTDLNHLTRLRSSTKSTAHSLWNGESLQLKYKLPIWPHQLPLHRMLSKLPNLVTLVLDGSEFHCLRELGSAVPSLTTLSVANCGLISLDGTSAFPSLRTLVASNNNLKHGIQCTFLPQLVYLDLSSNPIKEIGTFSHLRVCSKLKVLKLHYTPISRALDFIPQVKFMLPQLKEIHPSGEHNIAAWIKAKNLGLGEDERHKDEEGEDENDEDRLEEKVRRQEFEVIYRRNFEKASKRQREMEARQGQGDGRVAESTTEDSNFEVVLVKSVHLDGIPAISSDSYITDAMMTDSVEFQYFQATMSELDMNKGSETEEFFSAENSENESFDDASISF